jgi:hypothetical protein
VNNVSFDRRWLVVLVLLLIVLNPRGLIGVVVLGIGAGWALQAGLAPWRLGMGRIGGSTKVTYWRGQRIETKQAPSQRLRTLPITQLLVSVLYVVLGVGMAYSALLLFARLTQLL